MFTDSVSAQDSLTSIIYPEHNPGGVRTISPPLPSVKEMSLQEKLETKLLGWQSRMGLSEWQVWIKLVEPDVCSEAHVEYDQYHYQATVSISKDHPEEHWDHSIVHELLHIMLSTVQGFAEEILDYLDPREKKILEASVDPVFEPVLNRLARAIVGTPRPYLEVR